MNRGNWNTRADFEPQRNSWEAAAYMAWPRSSPHPVTDAGP